jgi:GNAT superfamily N-acetyltransferase
MQHIVAFVNDTPAAYTSFMETTEEDMRGHLRKVIYCYELQVEQIWQGKGIGQKLISMLEERAKESNDCQLVMLTCFKANKAALAFYKKNGYTSDETSPSQCAPSYKCDYEILSKDLRFK